MKDSHFVEELIITNISKGYHDIADIATQSGGIYPSELIPILNKLIEEGRIHKNERELYILTYPQKNCPQIILPEPHPLDFDWRFEPTSSKMILEYLIRENNYSNTILLLGSPSIFIEFTKLCDPPKVKLIDWNNELINYISKFEYHNNLSCYALDLFDENIIDSNLYDIITDHKSVNIVFFDPPWYVNDYKIFLAHASKLVKVGGVVMVALLSLNARPNAYLDRYDIFFTAKKLGLHIEFIEKNRIAYQTPLFEQNSLQNEGIRISKNWRYGDLVLFRKIHESNAYTNVLQSVKKNQKIETKNWISFLIRGYKIKINSKDLDPDIEPELISLEKNDILPTVSRRYTKRSQIDLWLWDNRVYGLKGAIYFINALYSISNLEIPQNYQTNNTDYLNKATTLLRKIL